MEARELRIGNYVWDSYSGEMIVREINHHNPVTTHPDSKPYCTVGLSKTWDLPIGRHKVKDIASIPLTKEWEKRCNIKRWTVMGETWECRFVDNLEVPEWIIYVHNLQNWYYWTFEKTELKFTKDAN